MEYSNEWLHSLKAQAEYLSSLYTLRQNEAAMMNDLSKALTRAGDNHIALKLLIDLELEVEVLAPLLPSIMDLAIDSTHLTSIALAKRVLSIYKKEYLIRRKISAFATTYLAENDEWHYRRITELYEVLGYEQELASFLLICQANPSLEIQEIAEDFNSAQAGASSA